MFRRHHVFASLSRAIPIAAFIGVVSYGCSDPAQATPRVTFTSSVTSGPMAPAATCGKTGPWFNIGDFGNPSLGRTNPMDNNSPFIQPVRPVDDGGSDQQGTVSISCSVTTDGDGFQVKAHAELTGATGGAVTITGRMTAAGDQPAITVNLSKGGETFSASDCTATFNVPEGQSIAAGRVWASVSCDKASSAGAQLTCASTAEFRFENCSQ